MGRPSWASQIRVTASPQVVATVDPSGLNATAVTVSLCPVSLSNSCLETRSQTTTARPSTPASAFPSGLIASVREIPPWIGSVKPSPCPSAGESSTDPPRVCRASHRPSGLNVKSIRPTPSNSPR